MILFIVLSLSIYFLASIYILPELYVKLPSPRPVSSITKTSLSSSRIRLGETFYLKVASENVGDTADMQILSIGFPNITTINSYVRISKLDFSQKPLFVRPGDKVGSDYTGLDNIVYARYPSIEAFSRPWHSKVIHHIELTVKPPSAGIFAIFLKAIALPAADDFSHYPRNGVKDYQNEFVKVLSVNVTQA
jgi:hypothetical protein